MQRSPKSQNQVIYQGIVQYIDGYADTYCDVTAAFRWNTCQTAASPESA